MEIRLGAYRHMESQPLQKGEYLCRGHRQYRYGHYFSSGVPAGGCHSSPLDKPGNVIFEEYRENPCIGQTCGMDHARHVAVYRHLPPCPRVHPLSAGVWQLSFHPRQRQQKRPLLPDFPQEAGVLYQGRHINFVTCSHWLEGLAKKSALLAGHTITCIPNPINTNLFKPHNKQEARNRCQLPQDARLVLFGSVKTTDKRKGIDYLVESCALLAEKHPELKTELGVVVFGKESQQLANLLPFKVYPLDFVSNEHQLVNIYNAVDLFVTPSLEENLPNMIMEAMACGIPCVGFNVGGIPEMIDHLHNGYVAQYKSSEDFANGIYWTLTDPDYPSLAEQACRKAVTHYSESAIAKKYIDLYNKVTGRNA